MKFNKDHIIQYLKGELPYYQQHELEKMMLEDPFLSDAIEGLQEIEDPEKTAETINEIEGLIESKYGKIRTIVPMYRNPVAIAAAISLIFISIAVVFLVPDYRKKVQSFLISGNTENKGIPSGAEKDSIAIQAMDEDKNELASESIIDTSNLETGNEPLVAIQREDLGAIPESLDDKEPDQSLLTGEEEAVQEQQTAETGIDEIAFTTEAGDNTDTIPEINADTDVSEFRGQQGVAVTKEQQRENEALAEPMAKRAAAPENIEKTIPATLKAISGRVTSATGNQPLSGVNILIKGSARGVISDAAGSYSLELPENENILECSLIGYQPAEINMTDSGIYNVSLENSRTTQSEYVISGYTSGEKRIQGSDRFATPNSSKAAYINYLRNNLVYPDTAAQNNVNGQVLLEFTVSRDGSISDITVISGIGFGCDEEATRLVREGPEWLPAIKNGIQIAEKIRISIRFAP